MGFRLVMSYDIVDAPPERDVDFGVATQVLADRTRGTGNRLTHASFNG